MDVGVFVKAAILELKDIEEASLVPEMTFEQMELDSLDYVEVKLRIKREFKVELDSDLFASGEIGTLGDLISYIEVRKSKLTEMQ